MHILPYLKTFVTVVDEGSFTSAARVLDISKPVVSKHVSQLEKHLGVQLLQRTTRRLHLTQAGEVFSKHSHKIMQDVQEAEQSVLPMQSEPQGRLRISASESLAMTLLPETLLSFQEKFPMIELDVRISGRFVNLVEEGIDIALRVGELEDSSLIARLLMPCAFHVCASPHYLQQHGTPNHPEDLSNHNCLVYSQSLRANIWTFKEKNGSDINIKIKGNLHSDAGGLLLEAALKNNGIFIGPTYMVAKPLINGQLVAVLDEYLPASTGLYAVYPYTKLVPFKVRVFVDYLVETWIDLSTIK